MRLEHIPLILGVLVALLGAGLVADALMPDGTIVGQERRRRARAPRHPRGEMLVGIGVLALAAALIGRDAWRFGTVSVIVGMLLVTAGALLNRHYLRELFSFRGALSRTEEGVAAPGAERVRTERVVRRPAAAESAPSAPSASGVASAPAVPGTEAVTETPTPPVVPPVVPPRTERRATPRGGEGPRRIR